MYDRLHPTGDESDFEITTKFVIPMLIIFSISLKMEVERGADGLRSETCFSFVVLSMRQKNDIKDGHYDICCLGTHMTNEYLLSLANLPPKGLATDCAF